MCDTFLLMTTVMAYYVHDTVITLCGMCNLILKIYQYFGKGAKRARRLILALSNLAYKERF